MKLLTRTKKEPFGVEMSVKEFLQVLAENGVVLELTVNNTPAVFTIETGGVDYIEEKGGRIFLTTEDSVGTFAEVE